MLLPRGSSSVTGFPQYQHIRHTSIFRSCLTIAAYSAIIKVMFTLSPCAAGCGRTAISGSHLCATHSASAEEEAKRIGAYITEKKTIKDLSAPGLNFISADFSGREFYGCNFMGSSFYMCGFSGAIMRNCYFDYADFVDCDFRRGDLQFLSFAGSSVRSCTFENSELLHLNFCGADIVDTVFDKSDLYNSRFIGASIKDCNFIDCNVKKVFLIDAKHSGLSFKSSNTAEIIHQQDET